MDLDLKLFQKIKTEYPNKGVFSAVDPMYQAVVEDLKTEIAKVVKRSSPSAFWLFEGSVGRGSWTHTPWVAIYDKRITDRASFGYYVVLFLNDSCTQWILSFTNAATKHINLDSPTFAAEKHNCPPGFKPGPIKSGLLSELRRGLGPVYEDAAVFWSSYDTSAESIKDLSRDLKFLADFYRETADRVATGGELPNVALSRPNPFATL